MMKRTAAFALMLSSLAAIGATSVRAEQLSGSEILFGKAYNDDVVAIQVQPFTTHYDGLPLSVIVASKAHRQEAQLEVQHDPALLKALSARQIALHNVIEVQTTGTGSKVVYYY